MKYMTALVASIAMLITPLSWAAIVEEVVELKVDLKGVNTNYEKQPFKVTVFRDDAATVPVPFIILGHGRDTQDKNKSFGRISFPDHAKWLVSKGFSVFVPTRVGYGVSGGPDVENSGLCSSSPQVEVSVEAAATVTQRTVEFAQQQPFVDPAKGVVTGSSLGGITAIAVAARNLSGVRAVVNFSGGHGGSGTEAAPCKPHLVENLFAQYGKLAKTPTLWIYSENDFVWGSDLPKTWFNAYVKNGAPAEFVGLPAYKQNGHFVFFGIYLWKKQFDRFLSSAGI